MQLNLLFSESFLNAYGMGCVLVLVTIFSLEVYAEMRKDKRSKAVSVRN